MLVLVRPPAVAVRIPWNRVCPFTHPVAFPGTTPGIGSLDFSEFCHVARNH